MTENNNDRDILSAALSAHVSELRLLWHDTNLSCRWLVPDGEHCFVDAEIIKHLKDFRTRVDAEIANESIRNLWLEKSDPILELDEEPGCMPFPLRTLTWLMRVAENPNREDLTADTWNLYLWSVRMSDLPSHIIRRLTEWNDGEQRQPVIDFDSLVARFAKALEPVYPTDAETLRQNEMMMLNKRFDRLRRFKNLVFYGVANIGKANLSKQLISSWKQMTGREIGLHCVTVFHANMGYEDLVERRISGEGFNGRPSIDHCAPRVIAHHIHDAKYFFEPFTNDNIQEGLLLSLCRAAAYNPERDFVFMVDCIDEARLEDVLGEVSHMLDSFARVPWRKGTNGAPGAWDLEALGARSIRLSQSGRVFFIPSNVYILGTANESGLFEGTVDDHLFQTFAVEYLQPKNADELRATMLSNRSHEAFARLEEYVSHSVDLWNDINTKLIEAGGHKNVIGYGPLLSMCEEILASSDVYDANRIVLGTWRYRMIPPIRVKLEMLLHGTKAHRDILDAIINILNQSWLHLFISIEGLPGSEAIFMTFDPESVL
ncbi:MAG: hypothetical protein IJU23_01255 [Proteobacteria bacterium]|nr:hypothetical protein [Pseudomonadota bacterium]